MNAAEGRYSQRCVKEFQARVPNKSFKPKDFKLAIGGKKILCTRPKEDAEGFKRILENAGGECIIVPMIEILPVENTCELDSKLGKLHEYSGIIFTSSNGVKHFFRRADYLGIKPVNKIFAVGEKTGMAVENSGFVVTLIPDNYDSLSLAKLITKNGGDDSRYLFPSGNLSMKRIANELNNVDEVVVYETRKPVKNRSISEIEIRLRNKEFACIAFFSPSAVANFAELCPSVNNSCADIAAIGNTTLGKIKELGLEANIIAKKATAESLAAEIMKYYDAR